MTDTNVTLQKGLGGERLERGEGERGEGERGEGERGEGERGEGERGEGERGEGRVEEGESGEGQSKSSQGIEVRVRQRVGESQPHDWERGTVAVVMENAWEEGVGG